MPPAVYWRQMSSDFLFARPSWISGVGRVMDLWGCFEDFNDSPTAEVADECALYSDWRMVGEDLVQAVVQEQERVDV